MSNSKDSRVSLSVSRDGILAVEISLLNYGRHRQLLPDAEYVVVVGNLK